MSLHKLMQNNVTQKQLQNLVFGEDRDDFIAQIQQHKINVTNETDKQKENDNVQNSFFESSDGESSKSWADINNQTVAELMDSQITAANVQLQQLSAINKSDVSAARILHFIECGPDIVVLVDENNFLKIFYADGSFKSFYLAQLENTHIQQNADPSGQNKLLGLCYIEQNHEVLVVTTYKILSLDLHRLKIQIISINYHYTGRRQRWQCCMDLKDGAFILITQEGEICFVNSVTKQIFQTQRLQFRPKIAFVKGITSQFHDAMIAVSDGKLGVQILQIDRDPLDGTYDVTQAMFSAQAHVCSIGLNQQYLVLGHVNGYISLISLQGIVESAGDTQTMVLRTASTPIVSLYAGRRFLYYCDRTKGRIVDFKDFSVLTTQGVLKGAQVKVLENKKNSGTLLWCGGSDGELRAFRLDFE